MDTLADIDSHLKVLVIRSNQPFKATLTVDCEVGEINELKSHDSDSDVNINQLSWCQSKVNNIVKNTITDKSKTKAIWSSIRRETFLSRSSSTSSFEAIMERPSFFVGESDCDGPLEPSAISAPCDQPSVSHGFVQPVSVQVNEIADDNHVDENHSDDDSQTINKESSEMIDFVVKQLLSLINLVKTGGRKPSTLETLRAQILSFYQQVLGYGAFLEIPLEMLVNIVSVDRTEPTIETLVVQSIIKWVGHKPERFIYLPRLLKHIKLDSLTPGQLISLSNESLVRRSLECRDMIDEIKNSLLMSQSMSFQSSSSFSLDMIHNQNHSVSDLTDIISLTSASLASSPSYMYILANSTQVPSISSIHQIDLDTGISMKISTDPTFMCVNLDDNIYVFCHSNSNGLAIKMYSFKTQLWTTKAYWPDNLVISYVTVIGKLIYFLGFQNDGPYSLYKYDPVGDLLKPIHIPYEWVAQEGDKIVAFEGLILFVKTGLTFNPVKQQWKTLQQFPEALTNEQNPPPIVAYKDRLIWYESPDKFSWFNPRDGAQGSLKGWNQWMVDGGIHSKLGPRIDFLVHNSRLYLVEKAINDKTTIQIVVYDDELDNWSQLYNINLVDKPIQCAISANDA